MGKKRVMVDAEDVDLSAVKYEQEEIKAPHLTGLIFKLFVRIVEAPIVGSFIISAIKKQNKMTQLLRNTLIPEGPMFKPEFPPQELEAGVVVLDEDGKPEDRVEVALKCLPQYDPASCWNGSSIQSFRYWRIRDYAYAYRSKLATPSLVAEHIISVIDEFSNKKPPQPLLITFNPEEVRSQAAASTKRFEEGNPLSILDGIFVAIKDDIDCFPHPSKGGTTWMHEVRTVKKDAVCVSRLRSCGVIFIGKANMHELGMGTTGNNSNYGFVKAKSEVSLEDVTALVEFGLELFYVSQNKLYAQVRWGNILVKLLNKHRKKLSLKLKWRPLYDTLIHTHFTRTTRNPHAPERYTGGSSSGPAALVASGLCSAALGTDGGGSVRIPSSLCGVVGLKTTYGRTDIGGSLCEDGTVEIIGPIASTVEDVMLVYSAILGTSLADRLSLKPSPPSVPNLSLYDSLNTLGSLRLGKYTAWFNDVHSTDISDTCEDVLSLLSKTHGCEMAEIVVPELHEMRTAHLISIGSEFLNALNPYCEDGYGAKLSYDSRTSVALFRSFSASDYIAAQCLRRRIMYHHMEIFKKVDVIVTPTTGMTAPIIPPAALKDGETDMRVTGDLMRFVIAGNLLGLPAISVPVGYDKQGLPIGLQLIGRPWGESSILRLASAIEELCAKSKKRPVQYFDVLKS